VSVAVWLCEGLFLGMYFKFATCCICSSAWRNQGHW